jgi:hypothetical protein
MLHLTEYRGVEKIISSSTQLLIIPLSTYRAIGT